jgi:hypothetical protein
LDSGVHKFCLLLESPGCVDSPHATLQTRESQVRRHFLLCEAGVDRNRKQGKAAGQETIGPSRSSRRKPPARLRSLQRSTLSDPSSQRRLGGKLIKVSACRLVRRWGSAWKRVAGDVGWLYGRTPTVSTAGYSRIGNGLTSRQASRSRQEAPWLLRATSTTRDSATRREESEVELDTRATGLSYAHGKPLRLGRRCDAR